MAELSIFHPSGQFGLKANPFGKDVANLQLFRALAMHADLEALDVLGLRPADEAEVAQGLLAGAATGARIGAGAVLDQKIPARAGALLRGQPDLADLAWLRRRAVGDRAYSLLGLAHTLAPPIMREIMAQALTAPVQPWDAVICTSPSVREALVRLYADWGDWLAERTGGTAPPAPHLPVVPLGVDAARFSGLSQRPEVRDRVRAVLDLDPDALVVLWVGRLSFFEKAFPQPMFRAVADAARETGVKAAFVLAGWFPAERDRAFYEEAARIHAPDIAVRFADGNDSAAVDDLWGGADVFLSLVDNIQETFGITPLEAMAAGLPVVASDWDGYRSTVRDGVEGFLVPTLIPPAGGLGESMVARHVMQVESYQSYAGAVAQHTAVHPGRAAEALARLFRDPVLRARMGAAGRARVAEAFDWPVVARQYRGLLAELAALRAAAPDPQTRHRYNPAKGDPFAGFVGFPTQALGLDAPIAVAAGIDGAALRGAALGDLDRAFQHWRSDLVECARALDLLASGEARTPREVLAAFPVARRRAVELGLVWLAKLGYVDWLT